MRFRSFEIRNFRGVEHAKIDLLPAGAGVFTLIGLNESGKTTVLEAIGTFQLRGLDEKSLFETKLGSDDPYSYVPKHEKATFTGEITVAAVIEFERNEKQVVASYAENSGATKIDINSIPNQITVRRGFRFKNGDYVGQIHSWSVVVQHKQKGSRKFTSLPNDHESWGRFTAMIGAYLPEIVYFPTFLFEQPEKIVLNPVKGERAVDRVYRKIIENVGGSLHRPIDVQKNVVDRIIQPETPGEIFAGLFSLSNNRQQQVESAISQMSHHLSMTVLSRWSKIFGGLESEKEVRLRLGVDKHSDGSPRVYVQFSLRDGTEPYDIAERSLGFRWFFSFLLFTLYRSPQSSVRPTLFLLDEPASNLHAGAQMQLLESFPRIATGGSQIMYSTHSHYMINPEWLDQALIISNDAVDYDDLSGSSPPRRRHSHVTIEKYRTFVGANPDKTTYFQPVLDRLEVVPSRLDALQPAILVEGKGDYLLLSSGLNMIGLKKRPYTIIPTRGAEHLSELVGILLGWGVNFAIICDDDVPGRRAAKEFTEEWGMPSGKAMTLYDVHASLKGKSIESMLESDDLDMIREHYQTENRLTKKQIQLFFSERLASQTRVALSSLFKERLTAFDTAARSALGVKSRVA